MREPMPMLMHEDRITEILLGCVSGLERPGRRGWSFSGCDGLGVEGCASITDDWFVLDVAQPDGSDTDAVPAGHLWNLLCRNAELGGGAKFVLSSRRRRPFLRAEVPLERNVDPAGAVRLACAGCLDAARRSWGGSPTAAPRIPDVLEEPAGAGGTDPRALCREAGWEFSERASGRLSVVLDVPGEGYRGLLSPRGGGLAVTVVVAACEVGEEVVRESLGFLLLSAGGFVRMARGAADEGRGEARFEVVFEVFPGVAELRHALSALSVASRISGREARALESKEIAEEFWALRGWSP